LERISQAIVGKAPEPGHNRRIAFGIQPAVLRQMLADFELEAEFSVEGQG
jgi:hypothetical protein